MRKSYNQSQALRDRETRCDPAFWEIQVDQEVMVRFSSEQDLHYESADDIRARVDFRERTARLMPLVAALMDEVLTPRQREVVELYFLEGLTLYEIADRLGISAPSVSQHLFGKARGGKTVGGAIPKLRKKLALLKES